MIREPPQRKIPEHLRVSVMPQDSDGGSDEASNDFVAENAHLSLILGEERRRYQSMRWHTLARIGPS
jgi:hypothetical protein